MKPKVYCFDIDGTICETEGLDYANAVPIQNRIDAINRIVEGGHTVIYYTARGMSKGDEASLNERFRVELQLLKWGCPVGKIYAKPAADAYFDDLMLDLEWLDLLAGESVTT